MKKLFASLQLSPGFVGFVVAFAYLDSIRSRIAPGQVINAYIFTPEALITTGPMLLLVILLLRFFFKRVHGEGFPIRWDRAILSFLLGLTAFLLLGNVFSYLISLAFGTFERNFNRNVLWSNNLTRALDFVVYGGFYFGFLLIKKVQNHLAEISDYRQALADSTISQLKSQLNPHFLFNNLNVLDQLIEQDPQLASSFLQDFSEIYRYVLEKSDQNLVDLDEELAFAGNYFRLLEQKYGGAYTLTIDNRYAGAGRIPPLTLQLLLENAVFHNYGTIGEPIRITVEIDKKIRVINQLRPFKFPKPASGRGLENLKRQYAMLSHEEVKVEKSEHQFFVELPLIPNA